MEDFNYFSVAGYGLRVLEGKLSFLSHNLQQPNELEKRFQT